MEISGDGIEWLWERAKDLIEVIEDLAKDVGKDIAKEKLKDFITDEGKHHDLSGRQPQTTLKRLHMTGWQTDLTRAPIRTHDRCTMVTGSVFYGAHVNDLLANGAATVLVVRDELARRSWLHDVNLTDRFRVCLRSGRYSFYVLLLDRYAREHSLRDAKLYGIGMPSIEDLSGVDWIPDEPPGRVANLLDFHPVRVPDAKRFSLDMILVDVSRLPAFPTHISELIESTSRPKAHKPNVKYDFSGDWRLTEQGGNRHWTGEVFLDQTGPTLSGVATNAHIRGNQNDFVVQHMLAGQADGNHVRLWSTRTRVLSGTGTRKGYQWFGTLEDRSTITGEVRDKQGRIGNFTMRRLIDTVTARHASEVAARARRQRSKNAAE